MILFYTIRSCCGIKGKVRTTCWVEQSQMLFWYYSSTGLSLSFNSPLALIFTPIANLLLCGWIVSTTGQFTCNTKGHQTYSASTGAMGYGPYWQTCLPHLWLEPVYRLWTEIQTESEKVKTQALPCMPHQR